MEFEMAKLRAILSIGAVLVAAGSAACGGSGSAQPSSVARAVDTQGIKAALQNQVRAFPNATVSCTSSVGEASCFVTLNDYLHTLRSASGATVAEALSSLGSLPTPQAEEKALKRRRAAAAKAAAAHRAAVAKAQAELRAHLRAVAARRARARYCGEIERGQHNGLTIAQVVSYCGQPSKRQHIAVTGLTEDYLYYGDVLSGGRLYQLAFTNGYLSGASYY